MSVLFARNNWKHMQKGYGMKKKDFLTKREHNIVNLFSSELKSKLGNNLILINLIGSKARGDFGIDSDIDILIVVKDYSHDKDKILDILYNIDPYYETKISPVIYSEIEYIKNKEFESPFILAVENEGIYL